MKVIKIHNKIRIGIMRNKNKLYYYFCILILNTTPQQGSLVIFS